MNIFFICEGTPEIPNLAFVNFKRWFLNHFYHRLEYSYALSERKLYNLRGKLNSQWDHTVEQEIPLNLNLVSVKNVVFPKLYYPCPWRVFSDLIGCQEPILKAIFLFMFFLFLQLHPILKLINNIFILQEPSYIFLYHQSQCLLFSLCLYFSFSLFLLSEEFLSSSCFKYVERLHFNG